MRPTPVADDELYDDPSPRVVPIGTAGRPRAAEVAAPRRVLEPWTPRDYPIPAAPRRVEPRPEPPPSRPRLSLTHKLMVAVFALICLSMVLGMVAWRLVSDARRPVEAAPVATAQPVAPPPVPVGAVAAELQPPAAAPGTSSITTEVRVIQPNYSVAPGDTLASIARRHGTTVDALASINNLENRNALKIGQRLIIP